MIKEVDYKEIENNYIQLSSSSHRSEFAQFFTPIHVAKLMMCWLESGGVSRILDPAFGLGVFYNALSHVIVVEALCVAVRKNIPAKKSKKLKKIS